MIDIKIAALTGILGLVAVDTGAPTGMVHSVMFDKSSLYTSEDACVKHISTIERQKPELKGTLSCTDD